MANLLFILPLQYSIRLWFYIYVKLAESRFRIERFKSRDRRELRNNTQSTRVTSKIDSLNAPWIRSRVPVLAIV